MNQEEKPKKKLEWSKLLVATVVTFLAIYGIWCGYEYYTLTKLAIEYNSILPDATLAVTCVGTILGAVLSYCLYQGALKTSLNKNKLTIDKATGIVRALQDSDFMSAVEQDAVQDTVEDCDKQD